MTKPTGPIIDQAPPRVPNAPIDRRYNDKDFKTPLSPTRYTPIAKDDAFEFPGKTGQKL